MNCTVERILVGVDGRRRAKKVARYIWRCIHCKREFPYDAVLHLAGCTAPKYDPWAARNEREFESRERRREERAEKLRPKIEPDKKGKLRLVYRA